jgi:hypothetical protein
VAFSCQGSRMNTSTTTSEKVLFKFQDLEITPSMLVILSFEEKTIIPLKEIASYDLKWYLHDPIFAKKYWFLELTVGLKNGEEHSLPIAVVKFNYLNDEHEVRRHIQTKISDAIDTALLRACRLCR